jgi:YHS domain-containing protein
MKGMHVMKSITKRARVMQKAAVIGIVTLLLAGFALFVSRPASTEDATGRYGARLTDRTRVCMLQDTVQAQTGLEYEYQGKKYYLCCGGCLAAFKAGADQYSTAVDPVTEAKVDKATAPIYAYQGHAYFFASEESLAKFAQEPQRYVNAALHQWP